MINELWSRKIVTFIVFLSLLNLFMEYIKTLGIKTHIIIFIVSFMYLWTYIYLLIESKNYFIKNRRKQ